MPSRHQAVAITLIVWLSHLLAFANVDPKKGRVTTSPTSGNSYTIEHEVDYGRKAIPEIEKDLPLCRSIIRLPTTSTSLATSWPTRPLATSFRTRFVS